MTELIKVSSKGQVVIPSDIRQELGISPGSQLVASRMEDFVILKKVVIADPNAEFKRLSRLGRKFADKRGVKSESDVMRIIHKSRGIKSD